MLVVVMLACPNMPAMASSLAPPALAHVAAQGVTDKKDTGEDSYAAVTPYVELSETGASRLVTCRRGII